MATDFTPRRRLTVGEHVDHARFGRGVVLSIDRKVARVAFGEERVRLIAGSLTPIRRPSPAAPAVVVPAAPLPAPEPKGRHADRVGSLIVRNSASLAASYVSFTGDGPV